MFWVCITADFDTKNWTNVLASLQVILFFLCCFTFCALMLRNRSWLSLHFYFEGGSNKLPYLIYVLCVYCCSLLNRSRRSRPSFGGRVGANSRVLPHPSPLQSASVCSNFPRVSPLKRPIQCLWFSVALSDKSSLVMWLQLTTLNFNCIFIKGHKRSLIWCIYQRQSCWLFNI